jgi:hypothetical protein
MVAFEVQRCAASGTSGRMTTMANVSIIANEAAITKSKEFQYFLAARSAQEADEDGQLRMHGMGQHYWS